MSLPSDAPEDFSETRTNIKSLIGKNHEEVIMLVGKPKWTASEGDRTYHVYQWISEDAAMMWVGYFPFPVIENEIGDELHCILLEYGTDNNLQSYKIDSEGISIVGNYYRNCAEVFGMQGSALRVQSPEEKERQDDELQWILNMEAATYCPNADLGHADAQKHIGDLYYFGSSHPLKKDLIRAYVWYSLAANSGDKGAAEQVDILTRELSPGQLSKAQILLEEWEPGRCERNLTEAITEGNK